MGAVIEAWVTDEDLAEATDRFTSTIQGFVMPIAHGVARLDEGTLHFGHANKIGAARPLPAVVLASVCGYVGESGVFQLDREDFAEAVRRLTPAESAIHMPHPNLWSWRDLLAGATSNSVFLAFFVANVDDTPVNGYDAQFRDLIATD